MNKKRYTKKDIIKCMLENSDWSSLSEAEIERTINNFIFFVRILVAYGFIVDIRGLGVFSPKTIPECEQAWNINKGRLLLNNNHKGARIKFPARKTVSFKPSQTFRKIIIEIDQEVNAKKEVKNTSKPVTNYIKNLENATQEELKEAVNLITEEAKRTEPILKIV